MPAHKGKVFISTEKFAESNKEPLEKLLAHGFEVVLNSLGRRLTPKDYSTLYTGVDYVIAGIEEYPASFFGDFPRIRVLSRVGIGLNSIDLSAAEKAGVAVLNTPQAPTESVAELTLGFILSLARNLSGMQKAFESGEWKPHLGVELKGETLGLVGFGRIGKRVAELARVFGMRVLAHDTAWDAKAAEARHVEKADLVTLLKESRFVSIHVPLERSTKHLIGERELSLMRKDAFLINTARGGIVEDAALIRALQAGNLAGSALDVFEKEPDPETYRAVPRMLFSPHIGSNTGTGRYRMELGAVENLIAWLEKK